MNLLSMFDFAGDPGAPDKTFDYNAWLKAKNKGDAQITDLEDYRKYARGQREKYSGRADIAYGKAGESFDKSGRILDTAGKYGTLGARLGAKAGRMADDSGYYQGLQDKVRGRGQRFYGLGEEARKAGQEALSPTGGRNRFTSVMLDSLQDYYASQEKNFDTEMAGTSLSPAALAKMKQDRKMNFLRSTGEAFQKGQMAMDQKQMQDFATRINAIGTEANMINLDVANMMQGNAVRGQQMSDLMNTGQNMANFGRFELGRAGATQNLGCNYMNMSNAASNNMRFYDAQGTSVTDRILSDARGTQLSQEERKIRDAQNQYNYDRFKAGSGQRGFNNLVKAGTVIASFAAAPATGGASLAAGAMSLKASENNKAAADASQNQQSQPWYQNFGFGNSSQNQTELQKDPGLAYMDMPGMRNTGYNKWTNPTYRSPQQEAYEKHVFGNETYGAYKYPE